MNHLALNGFIKRGANVGLRGITWTHSYWGDIAVPLRSAPSGDRLQHHRFLGMQEIMVANNRPGLLRRFEFGVQFLHAACLLQVRFGRCLSLFWEQLAKRVVHLSFEFENCEMDARTYRVSLHFSLHYHLLPYHHLFLHYHFLLNRGLAFLCENAGVGMLRRQRLDRLDRFGRPDISIGHSDVQSGMSRRGRQENNGNQDELAHRRLHLMMATASHIQA